MLSGLGSDQRGCALPGWGERLDGDDLGSAATAGSFGSSVRLGRESSVPRRLTVAPWWGWLGLPSLGWFQYRDQAEQ